MALSNKVAAIFGAGPGNGAAFAKKFLAQGYVVAVTSRSAEKMADLAASLGPTDKIKGYACDVTSDVSVDAAVETIKKDFGTAIHTVVYNAGSGGFKPLDECMDAARSCGSG